ncbi:MAG: hypothetical protein KDK99_03240 [Verrucomicrobiales bacterium]|nr:hypothetical protein [Verrucomicrobiales bacterium]
MQTSRLALLAPALLAGVTLSSCSLPPQEAWQQIQSKGLLPYVYNEIRNGSKHSHDADKPQTTPQPAASQQSSQRMLASQTPAPRTPATTPAKTSPAATSTVATNRPTPAPSAPPANLPTATAVATLPGYVNSPYTTPARLVDVRGMTPGSKVVCPYTQRPFLVPAAAVQPPAPAVASAPKVNPTPAPTKPTPSPAAANKPQPKPTAVASNTPANNKPKPSPAPAPQPKVEVASDLPFGTPIAGRPGFVNSPYAAKHQLVDVTGLPTGMEVKCPYSGKLFRVPPQAQAKKN